MGAPHLALASTWSEPSKHMNSGLRYASRQLPDLEDDKFTKNKHLAGENEKAALHGTLESE